MQASDTTTATSPFSFSEILSPPAKQIPHRSVTVVASDGVELAVKIYKPSIATASNNDAGAALVFYHGGGAHSGAGYQHLASGLSERFGLAVYLPDIRGHGSSAGPRGDAPSREQVWRDVDSVLEFAAADLASARKIYLGGHSSGGGLVLNYSTWRQKNEQPTPPPRQVDVEGYVLVAPELGYRSRTARPGRRDFASVNFWAFVANGILGVLGHSRAVRFAYPLEILEGDGGMVGFNTVNMANAITPESPAEQMRAIGGSLKPIGIWIGSEDELFLAEKVASFVSARDNERNIGQVIPGKNHLGILVGVHEQIGPWISRLKN